MSTLKATNIKNESSASNNIVLDSGGGAIFSGVTTFSSSVNFNNVDSLNLGTGTTISSPASNTFIVSTNGSERVRVDSLGDVGIGTTNPQYTLDVVGDINLTGTFRQNGSQFVASRWTSGTGDDIYRLSGDVGIGTTNPQYSLDVVGDINFTGTFRQNGSQFVASRWTSGIGDDIYRLSGDVGIGTTNPIGQLQVSSGPAIIGSATSTGTSSQTLQVTGGAYVSGNLGVGHTRPTSNLDVIGNGNFTGIVTATTFSGSFSGNATTATNISNSGTVILGTAVESNSITITQPSYVTDQPVKLLNFDWYGNTWSLGNIRSGSTPSNGFGVFSSGTERARFTTSGLTVTGTITATTLVETSSITLKENISPIENALDKILQLNPVTYDRKNNISKNEAGLIAEEVNEIIPNIVSKDSEGNPNGINYTKLSVYLIDAIKTLKKEIEDLRNGNS